MKYLCKMITLYILLFLVIILCVNIGESMPCTKDPSTNECTCPTEYKNNNGTCEAECTYPCGKGICYKPNMCRCFDGYKINLDRLRQLTDVKLPVCTPLCKNCTGECVAPNTCIVTTTVVPATTTKVPPTTSTTLPTTSPIVPTTITLSTTAEPPVMTTTVVAPTTTVTPATTTVPVTAVIPTTSTTAVAPTTVTPVANTAPAAIINTLTPLTSTTNEAVPVTITTSTVSLTTTSTTSISSTGSEEDSTTQAPITDNYEFDNKTTTEPLIDAHTLDPSLAGKNAAKQTWIAQDWIYLIMSLVIATAIILLLLWRRKSIIGLFKGRSYVVEDVRPGRNRVQYSRTAQEEQHKDAYC